MTSLLHQLFYDRAKIAPEQIAFLNYDEKSGISVPVSNLELHQEASKLAAYFKKNEIKNAVLLFEEHNIFVKAFMACLYAGVVAIPLVPPNSRQPWTTVEKIVSDTNCTTVICTKALIKKFERKVKKESILTNLLLDISMVDSIPDNDYSDIYSATPKDLAFLQYTSGSTGSPKGVKINHANILANLEQIQSLYQASASSQGVIWLPPYHDMGLIGGIMLPLFIGFPVTFISSVSFFKSPVKWLKLISERENVISGGPNFAYDLCIDKITESECEGLDLSSWKVAFNGAEKIHYETLQKFKNKFEPYGFKESSFLNCYGMAESTLLISGLKKTEMPSYLSINKSKFAEQKVRIENYDPATSEWLVSSGKVAQDYSLSIVCPQKHEALSDNQIGEIWVSGNSVSEGYWNKPDINESNFNLRLGNRDSYFRTGDLGFLHQDHLYITGRIKELVIVKGKNYYPQDIERTASEAHPALHACTSCFFSSYYEGQQHLFVIQEVKRTEMRSIDTEAVCFAIQSAISAEHGVRVAGIFLARPATIMLTSSGKIRRFLVENKFIKGELKDNIIGARVDDSTRTLIKHWYGEEESSVAIKQTENLTSNRQEEQNKSNEMIQWLREYANTRINSSLMDERRSITPNIILDFGNQGFFGIQIPKKYGGLGMSYVNSIRIFRQLSAIDLSIGMMVGINHSLGTRPIVNYARKEFQDEVLPRMAAGRELSSFAFTEPAAGSNPRGIRSIAKTTGKNRWSIRGQKEWIGLASWASTISTFAHLRGENGKFIGITGFALRQGDKGLKLGPEAMTMGVRSVVQNKIYLEDVTITEDRLLGQLGKGMEVAQDVMAYARFGIGCACLGVMHRCAQLGLRYASRRTISTGNLLQNPLTVAKLSKISIILPATETLVFRIGELLDSNYDVPEDAFNACKIILPELLWKTIDDISQLLGGRGYIEPNILPQIMRDARVLRIFEGPTETLKMYLGSQTVNDNSNTLKLISEGLKAPEVAILYQKAVDEVKSRMQKTTLFNTNTKNHQWYYLKLGDISAYAIMLAAVTGKGAKMWLPNDSGLSIEWVKATFEELVESTLNESIFEKFLLSNDEIINRISQSTMKIGDLEQSLAGEDHVLDPFLRKQFSKNGFSSAYNHQNGNHASSGSDNENVEKVSPPETNESDLNKNEQFEVVSQWIKDWVTNRLNLPKSIVENKESTFFDMGMDSLISVDFVLALETWLQTDLDTSIVWNFPTIEELTQHLCDETGINQQSRSTVHSTTNDERVSDELPEVDPIHYKFELNQRSTHLQDQLNTLHQSEVGSPYFKSIEGVSKDTVHIANQEFINYSGYNYLGLAGHPSVLKYAQNAIEKYGTSVSASRIISGEIQLHSKLEKLLCKTIGFDECVVFTTGHATNVTTIGHLFGPKDLILYDSYIHSSILEGAKMAGATRMPYPHNDLKSLEEILTKQRKKYQQTIIITEGVFSMDGDIIDLPTLIELKKKHHCYLMIDEAHSLGVIGASGKGISEHFDIKISDVDIWMGTLSKSLASCGGYIGGSKEIIDYLKYTASGFIYSVGMTPANTAAAIEALTIMTKEPERVTRLIQNADFFRKMGRKKGFDIGLSAHSAVVPIIIGDTQKCFDIARIIQGKGINVMPIAPPAVPENTARFRFFINTLHTEEQIKQTLDIVEEAVKQVELSYAEN
ncbi:MAG: aminotransferase class I/II-fold pyridoxal phosphate-dependent enzyme [Bacteroidota bacterium]